MGFGGGQNGWRRSTLWWWLVIRLVIVITLYCIKMPNILLCTVVKNLPAYAEDVRDAGLIPRSGRFPLRRPWQPIPVFLPGIPWTQEPGRIQSIGSQRIRHDWSDSACTHAHLKLTWFKKKKTPGPINLFIAFHCPEYSFSWHSTALICPSILKFQSSSHPTTTPPGELFLPASMFFLPWFHLLGWPFIFQGLVQVALLARSLPIFQFQLHFFSLCSYSRRRQWHPTPILLPGKSHGWRSLVGYSPCRRGESDMTEWLHFHFSFWCTGEGNGNTLQCSCLENPRDRGAWWAAVYGVAQSRTRLTWLSSSIISVALLENSFQWAWNYIKFCVCIHHLYPTIHFFRLDYIFLPLHPRLFSFHCM